MCEAVCNDEINKVAKNYFDTYPTDDYFVTYALGAIEKGREFGATYECNACRVVYPGCKNDAWRQQVLTKYQYLLEVTNYVLDKIPSWVLTSGQTFFNIFLSNTHTLLLQLFL